MDLDEMHKKVKLVDSLQEDTNTYGSHPPFSSWLTELEVALAPEEKWYYNASKYVIEMTCHAEEDQNTLHQEVETHVKALKTLEDEVIGLRCHFMIPFNELYKPCQGSTIGLWNM